MFGRRRRGFSRAASLARKRGRPLGRAPRQKKAAAAPKATSKSQDDKARAAFAAAQQKTAAPSKMATAKQGSNSGTLTPPTGVMKGAKTTARAAKQAGITGKAMGGYTERWAKARGKK